MKRFARANYSKNNVGSDIHHLLKIKILVGSAETFCERQQKLVNYCNPSDSPKNFAICVKATLLWVRYIGVFLFGPLSNGINCN